MLKHVASLLQRDTRKPLEKVGHLRPIFQVLEKRSDRNARATKDPRTADALGIAFNNRA